MEVIQLNAKNVSKEIKAIIQNQKECIVWGIPDKNYVFSGRNTNYNKLYCEENGIEILEFPNEGGVIVISNGDFDIGHFSFDLNNSFNLGLAKKVEDYLLNKKINAKFIGNDLIVDNKYKCASFSSRKFNNILYSAFHFSLSCNLELIKNICTKPMVKIPNGLTSFGISLEEIKTLFEEFIKEENYVWN